MTNIILTKPQGIIGVPGTSTLDIIIPSISAAPNNIVVVDTTDYTAIKWIYTLIDDLTGKILMAEVLATRGDGSPDDTTYNQYGIIGERLKHTINVTLIGAKLGLEITNLHINQLKSSIIQIQVAPP